MLLHNWRDLTLPPYVEVEHAFFKNQLPSRNSLLNHVAEVSPHVASPSSVVTDTLTERGDVIARVAGAVQETAVRFS